MKRFFSANRIASFFVFIGLIIVVYIATLYELQMFDDGTDKALASANYEQVVIPASRGSILDRNGKTLVSSRQIYNIALTRESRVELIDEVEDTNAEVKKLIDIAIENNVKYNDTFPMTYEAPFAYVYSDDPGTASTQKSRINEYFEYFNLDKGMSAQDFFYWIKTHYSMDYTMDLTEARRIIGVRYEMEMRAVDEYMSEYVFAEDVDVDFISLLEGVGLKYVRVEQTTTREFHTNYAGHILGSIGDMEQEELEEYPDYPMNAQVGKYGAEYAFENYLHGENGVKGVYTAEDGSILEERIVQAPIAGNNVYLTIDIDLQRQTEEALNDRINEINIERVKDKEPLINGASAVVVDIDSGQVLAAASWPTYAPSDYENDELRAQMIADDENSPLFNKATYGLYEPGSTFKLVTSLAGLRAGFIDRYTTYDTAPGYYDKYEGSPMRCWLYSLTGGNHEYQDVVNALGNSCNMFFYWIADNIDIQYIIDAAHDFGLGLPTGIELPGYVGQVSSPEYKMEDTGGEEWYPGDSMLAGIGQGYSLFTPVQLANYAATIANGGTHYQLTILDQVKSHDFSSVVYKNMPKVMNVINEYIDVLQDGMLAVGSWGSAIEVFNGYYVNIGAKTGTVQSDSSVKNNGVFICYAPAEDPEIAIAVAVTRGGSGTNIMHIARQILDYYYAAKPEEIKVIGENVILP